MWVEFFVAYCLCAEDFNTDISFFLQPQKRTHLNCNSAGNTWPHKLLAF